jgi:hypothetical protein
LVDRGQLKWGKFSPTKTASAFVNGTRDSVVQRSWSPLLSQLWQATKGSELQIAGELAVVNPGGAASGFVNVAGKTTVQITRQRRRLPGQRHGASGPPASREARCQT